jgi:uroporphyrinogen-III decarboxylase
MAMAVALGCEVIDIDGPTVSMTEARRAVGAGQVLCGNLDPVRSIHDGTPGSIRKEFLECHTEAGSRYIVAAGCEIPRGTPLENFEATVLPTRLLGVERDDGRKAIAGRGCNPEAPSQGDRLERRALR